MQDTKDKDGLTPMERLAVERKADRQKRTRAQIQEDREDVTMDLQMEKLGLTQRTDGKAATTNRIHQHTQNKNRLMQGLQQYAFGLASAAASITAIFKNVTDLAYSFGKEAAAAHAAQAQHISAATAPAQDEFYYYDTAAVSGVAAQILNEEAKRVDELVQELRSESNAAKIASLTMQIQDLAKYYNMRPHPITGLYVHLYDEIERIEALYNPHGTLDTAGSVCFYCPLADKANLRGVKIVVADVYDQNPQEVQLTQQNIADAKAQAPAPSLHHT